MLVAFAANGRHAGKNTAGAFACEWAELRGIPAGQVAFGAKMKQLVAKALDIKPEIFEDTASLEAIDWFKDHGDVIVHTGDGHPHRVISGRDFIINLAEGARDLFGKRFWIEHALNFDHDGRLCAITDMRFLEEAKAVKAMGGVLVYIYRPGAETGRSEGAVLWTEVADVVIHNDKTLGHLQKEVNAMLDWWFM